MDDLGGLAVLLALMKHSALESQYVSLLRRAYSPELV
jgi:hypothetical protein